MNRYTIIAIAAMLTIAITTIIGTWCYEPEFGTPTTILWLLLLTVTITDLIDHKDYDN